jgi:hypothetical protein
MYATRSFSDALAVAIKKNGKEYEVEGYYKHNEENF